MSLYNKGMAKRWLEKWGLIAFMLLVLSSFTLSSQDDRRNRRIRRTGEQLEALADSIPAISDSLRAINDSLRVVKDSIARADSIFRRDSLDLLKKSSLDAPAFTAARDSIIEDFSDGKQLIYYYGDVTATYGNLKLTADYMEYDLKTSILYARGTKDSTGVITGKPVMTQGNKTYEMEEVRYNFNTMKARITNMVT